MTRRDQTPPPVIARRLNGIGLLQDAATALDEIQGAHDVGATAAINRALIFYNEIRKERLLENAALEELIKRLGIS